ncbi:hypothetical protein M8C21_018538, partial [Ambrosia artemisiifolia]
RRYVREEMLHSLLNNSKCRDPIRMSEKAFMTLCSILKRDGGLRPTQCMSIEEHVATFFHIVECIPEVDDFLAANDVMLESQNIIDDDIQVVYHSFSQLEQSSSAKKCKNKKRKVEQQDEDLASVIMNSVGSVANAIIDGNKIIQESNNVLERVYHREYTGEEIYNELEPMGLETHELQLAFNYLLENQAKARSLFTCRPQIRLTMLK